MVSADTPAVTPELSQNLAPAVENKCLRLAKAGPAMIPSVRAFSARATV